MGTQKNHLNETVLLSTENICKKLWVRKYLQSYAENFYLSKPVLCSSFPGCMMAIALGRESIENQNRLAHADCFSQLVRLLRRHKSSTKVMLMVIKVLGILCVGK